MLLNYSTEKTTDPGNRNKLIEAKFTLTPHPYFANEIKKANARAGRIRQELEREPKALPSGK